MRVIEFVISIEVEEEHSAEASVELLNKLEDVLAKESYTIYDQSFEEIEP